MGTKGREEIEIGTRALAHLRHQMRMRGLNESEMAVRLGVSQSGLSRILTEKRGISAGFLLRLHRRCRIPGDVLLNDTPRTARASDTRLTVKGKNG